MVNSERRLLVVRAQDAEATERVVIWESLRVSRLPGRIGGVLGGSRLLAQVVGSVVAASAANNTTSVCSLRRHAAPGDRDADLKAAARRLLDGRLPAITIRSASESGWPRPRRVEGLRIPSRVRSTIASGSGLLASHPALRLEPE